jgi:hypothetical protein
MVLATVPPVADLDQRLNAQPELLGELAAQRRSRFLAGFQSPAREAPLADVLATAGVVLGEQVTLSAAKYAADPVYGSVEPFRGNGQSTRDLNGTKFRRVRRH